jgi:phytoene dehydrogenase-like protein
VTDVVIVGAGLAGLTCAQDLTRAGVECLVLEGLRRGWGRVRTDSVDGFLLDRGFQILLTAYPQVQRRLDLDALGISRFEPGAIVGRDGRTHRVSDPLRRPRQAPRTLATPIASFADKWRAGRLLIDVCTHPVPVLLRRPDQTTAQRLARAGFSAGFIEAFWQPLFAGIQLDPDLEVSGRRFETILRMLATGATELPREGMGAIPRQIASTLPEETVRVGAGVARVQAGDVLTEDGERVRARAVIVATDGPTAHRLLGDHVADPGSRPVACCWYATPEPPLRGPLLVLDGERSGPAKNVAVMSEVASSYAPPGTSLVAAAVPGAAALDPTITARVGDQLARWFGSSTRDWRHLRTDVIPHGQADQRPPLHPKQRVALGEGLFVCGDHRDTASIQGATFSGEAESAPPQRCFDTSTADSRHRLKTAHWVRATGVMEPQSAVEKRVRPGVDRAAKFVVANPSQGGADCLEEHTR